MALDLSTIQRVATAGRITWRYHALLRARERGITRDQAIRVLTEGEIIEQRPRAKPYPKCLMMQMQEDNQPFTSRSATTRPTTACISSPSTGSTLASGKTRGNGEGEDNHDNQS